MMLLAVRIHLEVMNVAASGDLLDSTVRKVDTVNIFSIYIYFIFLLSIFVLFHCYCGYFIRQAKMLLL